MYFAKFKAEFQIVATERMDTINERAHRPISIQNLLSTDQEYICMPINSPTVAVKSYSLPTEFRLPPNCIFFGISWLCASQENKNFTAIPIKLPKLVHVSKLN